MQPPLFGTPNRVFTLKLLTMSKNSVYTSGLSLNSFFTCHHKTTDRTRYPIATNKQNLNDERAEQNGQYLPRQHWDTITRNRKTSVLFDTLSLWSPKRLKNPWVTSLLQTDPKRDTSRVKGTTHSTYPTLFHDLHIYVEEKRPFVYTIPGIWYAWFRYFCRMDCVCLHDLALGWICARQILHDVS